MKTVLTSLLLLGGFVSLHSASPDDNATSIVNEGPQRKLIVHNPYLCPETVTVTATLENASCSQKLPLTVEIPPGATRDVCAFFATNSQTAWHFDYHWHYELGSATSHPDQKFVYALPYPHGKTYTIIQGFHGKFSHTGPYSFAIDWKMPEGSEVCAARDGLVVKIKADSDRGGPTRDFEEMANYIDILHSDGTIGAYAHLQQNGVRVTVGQRVKTGDVIALSGNTGFTSQPHLHFHVELPVDGNAIASQPIQFHTDHEAAAVLLEGQHPTAP